MAWEPHSPEPFGIGLGCFGLLVVVALLCFAALTVYAVVAGLLS